MIRHFRIEGLAYELHISETGEIALDLVGGATRKGSANRYCRDLWWDQHQPEFSDVDLGANALKLMGKVNALLLEYAFVKRPWRIGFSASTGRKVPIYRWLAERLDKRLKKYQLVEYPPGAFNFYRLACA